MQIPKMPSAPLLLRNALMRVPPPLLHAGAPLPDNRKALEMEREVSRLKNLASQLIFGKSEIGLNPATQIGRAISALNDEGQERIVSWLHLQFLAKFAQFCKKMEELNPELVFGYDMGRDGNFGFRIKNGFNMDHHCPINEKNLPESLALIKSISVIKNNIIKVLPESKADEVFFHEFTNDILMPLDSVFQLMRAYPELIKNTRAP